MVGGHRGHGRLLLGRIVELAILLLLLLTVVFLARLVVVAAILDFPLGSGALGLAIGGCKLLVARLRLEQIVAGGGSAPIEGAAGQRARALRRAWLVRARALGGRGGAIGCCRGGSAGAGAKRRLAPERGGLGRD